MFRFQSYPVFPGYTLYIVCLLSNYALDPLIVIRSDINLLFKMEVDIGFTCISRVRVMVFNATFNNTSAISWWSVLLVEEIGGPGENH